MEINDIITAISIKLNKTFGDSYTNYIDEVPQGFQAPAFFIQFLSLEPIRQIGNRWRIDALFNIQYFSRNDSRLEASDMTLKIQRALQDITLLNGDVMLGRRASSEIVDNVAHNFIKFNFYLQEIEYKELMGSLEHTIHLKEG